MRRVAALNEKKQEAEELVQLAVERAANFYEAHRLCCSEAVMVMMNQGFDGGLSAEAALQLGAGFCHGMGGAGCSCGALSGAVAALGLFLGPHGGDGFRKKRFQQIIREMHDRFRARFRSTCCRVLTRKARHDDKAQRANCLELTRGGAEIAVRLLLEARPDLVGAADRNFLVSRCQ
ncbi:MAG: C_GCAxxG_C_C family protein [Deltaproteobacteria bacterium]|nr:C_GCAxxG_C_C family protein [Deltaproteobacteria bacterium]